MKGNHFEALLQTMWRQLMTYYTTLDCLRLALIMGLGFLSKKITVLAAGRRWHSGDESRLVNRRPGFDSWCQLFFNLKKKVMCDVYFMYEKTRDLTWSEAMLGNAFPFEEFEGLADAGSWEVRIYAYATPKKVFR
ncbi:hypothetical protein ACROYT_G035339 [Oculina patagonica]